MGLCGVRAPVPRAGRPPQLCPGCAYPSSGNRPGPLPAVHRSALSDAHHSGRRCVAADADCGTHSGSGAARRSVAVAHPALHPSSAIPPLGIFVLCLWLIHALPRRMAAFPSKIATEAQSLYQSNRPVQLQSLGTNPPEASACRCSTARFIAFSPLFSG